MNVDLLPEVCLDAFLVARYCFGDGFPEGRAWERATSELLQRPGLDRHQQAGLTTLFGGTSYTGCAHEIDAAASGWRGCLIAECKAKSGGVDKADVATFDLKTFDYYCADVEANSRARWWRLLVSAGPVAPTIRALCFRLGIVLCDPERFPLPVLLHAASQPIADDHLPEIELAEVVRLGEPACATMHERWRPTGDGQLLFRPRRWSRQDVCDLLWLQDDLTEQLLDLYDLYAPERLERRVSLLRLRIDARLAAS